MTQEDKGYNTTKIQEPEALVCREVERLFESLFKKHLGMLIPSFPLLLSNFLPPGCIKEICFMERLNQIGTRLRHIH